MKNKISTSNNQGLLLKRSKTILQGGVKLSLEEEQSILENVKSDKSFMGIIPLRCQLGDYYFLNLNDDHVAEYLFWFGCFGYERSSAVLFTHLAMEADYVLDLGAYSGYFSVLSSVLAKNSNTYAVEANPLNFHRLCENLSINGANVVPCHYALVPSSDNTDTIEIFYNAGLQVLDTGSFASHELAAVIPQKLNKRDSFIVPTISLSSLTAKLDVPVVRKHESSYVLIKLDVEGLEVPLLRDIADFYSNSNFLVLTEILTAAAYQSIFLFISSYDHLSIAYINEHKQEICLYNQSEYSRQKGSRNFIIGNTQLIKKICNISLADLLAKYE